MVSALRFHGTPVNSCRWSILILTMPQRQTMLARLLEVLEPQIVDGVELLIRVSDSASPVGENRELLRQQSRGEYISFIDDDDLVSPYFVERILPRLDGVDYVGFNLEQTMDGRFGCIEKRSLRYGRVGMETSVDRFRDLSHLNPMRASLALAVPMSGWPAEDTRWADAIRALSIVKTEHYLDETLYYYLTRSHKPEMDGDLCRKSK